MILWTLEPRLGSAPPSQFESWEVGTPAGRRILGLRKNTQPGPGWLLHKGNAVVSTTPRRWLEAIGAGVPRTEQKNLTR